MASGNVNNKGKAVLTDDTSAPMVVDAIPLRAVPPAALPMAVPLIHPTGSQSQQLDKTLIELIKQVMKHCVKAMEEGNIGATNSALEALSSISSLHGDSIERLTAVFAEALARRALRPLQGLSWSIQEQFWLRSPPQPACSGVPRQWFHSLSPLLRAAALAANHAIVKAVEGEQHVHVVDLGGGNPRQWIELLGLLAARPGRAPSSLRLTIVSPHAFFLTYATKVLTAEARRLHLPFVLNPVRAHIDNFSATTIAALGVQRGEALVLSSTLELHRLLADAAIVRHAEREHETMTRADALLRVLRDLSPKLLVLTEAEADHNGGLWDRVSNAFDYYADLFNDLEVSGMSRAAADRGIVEQLHLREEIVDIVSRDGATRRERHEKMLRWAPRMVAAGFLPTPVTMDEFRETARLADRLPLAYSGRQQPLHRVTAVEEQGCFFMHSCRAPLFSVSLWQPAPRDV